MIHAAPGEGRPIRDLLYRRLAPLARVLAGVNPNTITVVSLISGCLAGLAYWLSGRSPVYFFLGGVLVAVSGLADALDGEVARQYGKMSAFGDFLDHFCDRLIEIAIITGVALSANADTILGLSVAIIVVLNSYLGTQIQASFGRRHYSGPGKAQLFIGLVLGSVALGIYPDAAVTINAYRLSMINCFLILVGLGSLLAIAHRLRLAQRLAAEPGKPDQATPPAEC